MFVIDMKGQMQEQQQLSQQQVIRRHGYELTPPSVFTLPTATNPTSLIKSLFRLFADDDRQKALFDPHAPKSLMVLDEKQAVLYHSNKLVVVRWTAGEEGMAFECRGSFLLSEPIKRVVCGYYGHRLEKNQQFEHFAVQYENSATLSLFRVDHQAVTLAHEVRESERVLAMRFTSSLEVVVLLASGKVSSYSIKEARLQRAKKSLKILLQQDQSLKNGQICSIGGSQPKILLFYLVHSRKSQKCQLHLKEYLRDSGGHLQELGTFYDIFDSNNLSSLAECMAIHCFGEGILIHQGLTVNVLQKRFGKYARSDVISQLANAKRITIIQRGQHVFICSMGAGELELWEVVMKDIGCSLQLLDVVEADGALLVQKLIRGWVFVHKKKPEFVLAVDGGPRQVQFFLTRKLNKLAKLTGRVRREQERLEGIQQRGQKSAFAMRLRQMEELGGRLGFRRREFYLKLWQESEKNSAHIVEFLLACKDFKVIFNEISLFLRVKKLTVTETIRILKRIEQSLLEELTRSLELELLRQFLKTNFQRRKLKLYSGEVQLDFQQYQAIYEASLFDMVQRSIDLRLFPEKFKHDIVWKQQTQQKPIQIPYILREFRLLILQDYPGFLLRLLQPYGAHLREVVQTYPYLLPQFPLKISVVREQLVMLSNIYEAEKIEQQQYSWLGYIRENEWQREASSLDFLHRHLFAHHPTSLIADKLRQFTEGNWCQRQKYSRHVLLEARRKEFEAKLPAISDGSSLLFVCEWANRLALEGGGVSDSEAIVEAMHRHNHLPLQEYHRYRLYSTLHHLLIRERLLDAPTTVIQLMQLAPERLVACFFLGDRQRIALLFEQVARHYPSREAFNGMVEAFVGSGECSKVQLEMLTNYLRRSGEHYQQESQQLIAIVLRGFLKRIEVREKDKAVDFLNLFRSVSLSQPLLITLALFETVKADCAPILKLFDLASLSYDTVINDARTVITSITHEFFANGAVRLRSIYIEGREVSLSYAQNLFVVVLYLKDKVYSYGQEMQLYLVFCEAVLGWNQFDLVRECFSSDLVIDDEDYLPEQFAALVVDYMLNKYYEDDSLLYCPETTDHILRLLSLIDPAAETAVVERAKMDFVGLLQPLGQTVSVQYMQLVRQQWEKQEERASLFRDVVDLFPLLDFQLAIDLYHALERMRTCSPRVEVKTDEFVQLALYICGKYVKAGQFERICEIISFLNAGEGVYRAKYSFMIECFLQVLHDRLQQPHHMRQSFLKVDRLAELANCRQLIDYFLSHFQHVDTITHFFATRFELPDGDTPDLIEVDPALCFSPAGKWVSRGEVWELIVRRAIAGSEGFTRSQPGRGRGRHLQGSNALDTRTILFTYYFICNVLHDTHYLFELEDISFHHVENVHVLTELARQEALKTTINFKSLYRQYLKGLFKIYVLFSEQETTSKPLNELPVLNRRVSLDMDVKIREIRNMDDSKLILLVAEVPLDKGDLDLLRAMKKLTSLLQSAFVPAEEREKPARIVTVKTIVQHSQHSLPLYFEAEAGGGLKQSVTQLALGHPDHLQVRTFRFLEFEKMKRQIASKSNMVSEKLIIGKVLDELENVNANRDDIVSESFLEEKITINRLMPLRQSLDEEQIGRVLEEMNLEKSNELIAIDLSDIHSLEHDQAQLDQIRELLEAKDYERVLANFPVKVILKAIDAEFYRRAVEAVPSRQRKRINRSNTLKESILNSRLIALLEALDGLKLYGSSVKARLLRSCLTTISSEELQSVQGFLLGVFRLNVLLDVTKNTSTLSKTIVENARESCNTANLNAYKIVVKMIEGFVHKCREQARSFKHSSKAIPSTHEAAELYYDYIMRLSSGSREQEEKEHELQEVMKLLRKEQLLEVHERLSNALSEGDLYIPYLQLIHRLYVNA